MGTATVKFHPELDKKSLLGATLYHADGGVYIVTKILEDTPCRLTAQIKKVSWWWHARVFFVRSLRGFLRWIR